LAGLGLGWRVATDRGDICCATRDAGAAITLDGMEVGWRLRLLGDVCMLPLPCSKLAVMTIDFIEMSTAPDTLLILRGFGAGKN
jgi:hypothetical protein